MPLTASISTSVISGITTGVLLSILISSSLSMTISILVGLTLVIISALFFAIGHNQIHSDNMTTAGNEALMSRLPVWFISTFIAFVATHHVEKFLNGLA